MHPALLLPVVLLLAAGSAPGGEPWPPAATYSIVAADPATGEIGVGVQSKIVAVGAVVPFAKAGVGAVATQAWANVRFGPVGLLMLETGATPRQAAEMLARADPEESSRQVGIVSASGEAATFTGSACLAWAGGLTGQGYAVQGNILAGEDVIRDMAAAFEAAAGELAERLLAALEAGQAAGGDKRGMQSAALLVVREGWGYGGGNDRYRDLRVDEHEQPVAELRRVYERHRALFPRPGEQSKPEEKPDDENPAVQETGREAPASRAEDP